MKIKIADAIDLSNKILTKLGFSKEDSKLITKNLIDAELAGKTTHGFVRLMAIKAKIDKNQINVESKGLVVINETPTILSIDAKNKPGFIPIYKSLELAIPKAKKNGVVVVGIGNSAYASGFIGAYAREAAEKDLIFIGFNNSPGGLVPHGSKQELWGTNPITVSIPSEDKPVILDMASSKITWGDLLVAKQENKKLPKGVAIDAQGKETTDPEEAMGGGLLPFFGHKGSGMGFIVELIAGAITGSRIGTAIKGGWGTTYILIDPSKFRLLSDFKKDVSAEIKNLKKSPKAKGVKEIYYPGEQSQKIMIKNRKKDFIKISDNLYSSLMDIIKK